ncbi:type IV secretion system protein [Pseudenterobacter timonensis]|uniref:Type IV secretion system protein n=1 Tax=Pseudenterobacter timonensis TaxID=1755099 RepID=A0ABV4ACB6_9ENTR
MKLFKRTILISLLSLSALTTQAGIPVAIDADPLRQAEWVKEAQRWMDTVKHYQSQLDAYKNQLATAPGIRDIQHLIGQSKNLANDINNLRKRGISLNDLLNNPNGSFDSQLNGLYEKYKVFDDCNENRAAKYKNTCKQLILNQAVSIEETVEVQNKISEVLADISTLTNRIEMSKDTKESQDLANVVNARAVQLNALSTQWEMSVKQAEQREKLLQKQRKKENAEFLINAPIADLNNL